MEGVKGEKGAFPATSLDSITLAVVGVTVVALRGGGEAQWLLPSVQ